MCKVYHVISPHHGCVKKKRKRFPRRVTGHARHHSPITNRSNINIHDYPTSNIQQPTSNINPPSFSSTTILRPTAPMLQPPYKPMDVHILLPDTSKQYSTTNVEPSNVTRLRGPWFFILDPASISLVSAPT